MHSSEAGRPGPPRRYLKVPSTQVLGLRASLYYLTRLAGHKGRGGLLTLRDARRGQPQARGGEAPELFSRLLLLLLLLLLCLLLLLLFVSMCRYNVFLRNNVVIIVEKYIKKAANKNKKE